jgi:hypothetical protein
MGPVRKGRNGIAIAVDAVVLIDNVEVALLVPGVTEPGEKLQEVCAGSPLHASFTAEANDPPTDEIVRV